MIVVDVNNLKVWYRIGFKESSSNGDLLKCSALRLILQWKLTWLIHAPILWKLRILILHFLIIPLLRDGEIQINKRKLFMVFNQT